MSQLQTELQALNFKWLKYPEKAVSTSNSII